MRRTVFYDLETGGLSESHPDIQLAAVAIDDATWTELDSFEQKIAFDPEKADPEALKLNHWTAEAWADAQAPEVVVNRFAAWLKPHCCIAMVSKRSGRPYSVCRLAGHNAATFDGPRLQRLFKTHITFLPADPRVRDTLQLALWHFDTTGARPPENYRLETLARYFGIPVDKTHEALADVRLTVRLARALLEAGATAAVGARGAAATPAAR